eukprot:jgi/Psemu1/36611/gm1.36611_g
MIVLEVHFTVLEALKESVRQESIHWDTVSNVEPKVGCSANLEPEGSNVKLKSAPVRQGRPEFGDGLSLGVNAGAGRKNIEDQLPVRRPEQAECISQGLQHFVVGGTVWSVVDAERRCGDGAEDGLLLRRNCTADSVENYMADRKLYGGSEQSHKPTCFEYWKFGTSDNGARRKVVTEKLAIYLLEKSDDLLSANLVVQFLDDNVVNNYGKGTGELNRAFKHLQGRDFVLYKPSDLLTWDCFKTSKVEINELNKSNNTYRVGWVILTFNTTNDSKRGFIPPWVVQVDSGNVAKRNNLNEGRNNDSDQQLPNERSKNKPNQSKESGIDTTKGNSKDTGLTNKTSKTCEKEGSNVREEKVIDLEKSPINAVVTLAKFPATINGRRTTQPFDICLLLKDLGPEIMFPIYKVNKQVCYTARRNGPVLIGEVTRYLFSAYEQYENFPGYWLIFKKGKAGEHSKWCPYFKVSGLKETNR